MMMTLGKKSFMLCLGSTLMGLVVVAATEAPQSKLVTVPLIPHHVHLERYRQLHGLSEDEALHFDAAQEEEELLRAHYQRRRKRAQDESVRDLKDDQPEQVSPLYQGYGTHYVDLWCGTPPQRQTVIVDTGSSITAFPCRNCNDCGAGSYHIDNAFDESASTSFSAVQCSDCVLGDCDEGKHEKVCEIRVKYQEGSRWQAYEVQDSCYIGGPHFHPKNGDAAADGNDDAIDPNHAAKLAFPSVFGCQATMQGLFKTQLADGIMGMDWEQSSYWYQMYNANKIDSKQFSLCYSRQPMASRYGTESGALTLGGTEPRLHTSPMFYTVDAEDEGFFSVNVRKVYLRDGSGGPSSKSSNPDVKPVQIDVSEHDLAKNGVIVDSGTTDTYWDIPMAKPFQDAFYKITSKAFANTAQHYTGEEILALPTILIQIKGDVEANTAIAASVSADPTSVAGLAGDLDPDHPYDVVIAVPPVHYMSYDPSKDTYTPRVYMNSHDGSVLGANVMMGHDILFDGETKRLGWATSDCDHTKFLQDHGFSAAVDTFKSNAKAAAAADSASGDENIDPSSPEDEQGEGTDHASNKSDEQAENKEPSDPSSPEDEQGEGADGSSGAENEHQGTATTSNDSNGQAENNEPNDSPNSQDEHQGTSTASNDSNEQAENSEPNDSPNSQDEQGKEANNLSSQEDEQEEGTEDASSGGDEQAEKEEPNASSSKDDGQLEKEGSHESPDKEDSIDPTTKQTDEQANGSSGDAGISKEDGTKDKSDDEDDVPEDKKTEPLPGGDSHDRVVPDEDIQHEAPQIPLAVCSGPICRGIAAGITLAVLLSLVICIWQCCCRSSGDAKPLYNRVDVEMTDRDFSTYKDDPDDDEEFGFHD